MSRATLPHIWAASAHKTKEHLAKGSLGGGKSGAPPLPLGTPFAMGRVSVAECGPCYGGGFDAGCSDLADFGVGEGAVGGL